MHIKIKSNNANHILPLTVNKHHIAFLCDGVGKDYSNYGKNFK